MTKKKTVELNAVTVDALKRWLRESKTIPGTVTGFIEMLIAQQVPMRFYELAQLSQDNPGVPFIVDERQTTIPGLDPASTSPTRQDSQPLRVGPAQPNTPDFKPHDEKKGTKQPNEGQGSGVLLL